jgi:uncharacterized protein (DUF58 family)
VKIPLLTGLWSTVRRRAAGWMAKRTPTALPITLNRRTVYIIPTGFGLFFALIVLVCVAGGLNYNNNLALLFAFLFAALGSQSMLLTFRNLSGLCLAEVQAAGTFAGQPLELTCTLQTRDDVPRTSLNLRVGDAVQRFELAMAPRVLLRLLQPTSRRGWHRPDFITVWTVWPFGLFDAWSYLYPEQRVLIWPRMEVDPPPLPWRNSGARGREREGGDDDIRGLRPYVSGDPMRRVAWKRSAARTDLLVRQFESPAQPELSLDIGALTQLPWEKRIERLSAWIDVAWRNNLAYRLILPARTLGPDQGEAHRRRCLDALAELPEVAG